MDAEIPTAVQIGRVRRHQGTPRRPVLEIGHRVVGRIGLEHVSHCLRVEHAAGRDQGMQLGGGAGLAAAKGPGQANLPGLARCAEEGLDVGGELGVVLEQEPVRGVGVDLHLGLRDQAG
jgi:hypothetical protein